MAFEAPASVAVMSARGKAGWTFVPAGFTCVWRKRLLAGCSVRNSEGTKQR